MVDDRWIQDTYRFMISMNRDKLKLTLNLGDERPYVEGPYFFRQKKFWDKTFFCDIIGGKSLLYWKEFIKKKAQYQVINCKDLIDGL